jgi:hypothetical protein
VPHDLVQDDVLRRRSSRLSRQEIHRDSWNSWDWLHFKCHPGQEWNVWDGAEYFWCKHETKQVTAKPVTLCYSRCSNTGAEAAGVLRTPKLWNVLRRFEIWLWKNSLPMDRCGTGVSQSASQVRQCNAIILWLIFSSLSEAFCLDVECLT